EKSQREEGEPIARCLDLGQTPREAERVGPERGERRARRGKRGGALEAAEARQVERGRGEREQLGVGGQPDPGREQGAERVRGGRGHRAQRRRPAEELPPPQGPAGGGAPPPL